MSRNGRNPTKSPRARRAFLDTGWESIITNDISNVGPVSRFNGVSDWFGGAFGSSGKYTGSVDDIVIGYEFEPMDGPGTPGEGNQLGYAGPRYTRSSSMRGARLPISGYTQCGNQSFEVARVRGTPSPFR